MLKALLGRETGTRTLVSAVRGRRPRPLDDISVEEESPRSMLGEGFASRETGTRTLVSAVRGRRPRPLDDISVQKRYKITAIF